MTYYVLKYIHVIGAVTILGTGIGIAFFMLMAHRTGNVEFIAQTAGVVVVADGIFTATAVVIQPVTGYLLLHRIGAHLGQGWVVASIILYIVAGAFWLPVVWIQTQMRNLTRAATAKGADLPEAYNRLFQLWFAFGFPGFGSIMAIIWMMIAKPTL
jgi:uncharacterized membrane protein